MESRARVVGLRSLGVLGVWGFEFWAVLGLGLWRGAFRMYGGGAGVGGGAGCVGGMFPLITIVLNRDYNRGYYDPY